MKKILLLLCVLLLVACSQDNKGELELSINYDEVSRISISNDSANVDIESDEDTSKLLDTLTGLKYKQVNEEDLETYFPEQDFNYSITVNLSGGYYDFYLFNNTMVAFYVDDKSNETPEFLLTIDSDVQTLVDEFEVIDFPSGELKVKKPVIYLYPEQAMDIEVTVEPDEIITTSYPRYEKGWRVTASPQGQLIISDRKYSYLYFEADVLYEEDFNQGFVVKREDSIEFLEEKLEILGLNDFESNDFITYWLPELEKHPYNKIRFLTEEVEDLIGLKVEPKPQTLIRVYMIFEGLEEAETINEQELKPVFRQGYTVVEWGGMEVE